MPAKKYLNDAGTQQVITETVKRIDELVSFGATVNIESSFSNEDCIITSDVLDNPITVPLDSEGSGVVILRTIGTYHFAVTVNNEEYTVDCEVLSNTTYTVTIKSKPKIVTWGGGTDEEIIACIEALDDGTLTTEDLGWDVGDVRTISLNAISAGTYNVAHAAQDQAFVIMEVSDYNGVGHYIIGLESVIKENETIELTNTNQNGWHNSRGRRCCDAIFDMIPSSISPIFKEFTVTTSTKGNSNTPGTTDQTCKISIPAEKEIFGTKVKSSSSEFNSDKVHSQLEWYKTSSNLIKRVNNTIQNWWERSPYYGSNNDFAFAQYESSQVKSSSTQASYGYVKLSPFFVI